MKTEDSNVVPEQEMNRRRRVQELADSLAATTIFDDLTELRELVAGWSEVLELLSTRVSEQMTARVRAFMMDIGGSDVGARIRDVNQSLGLTPEAPEHYGMPELMPEAIRMKKIITRLFAEAPKLPAKDQAPALECHVVLKAGQVIMGALSVTPEGTLRMMAMNEIPQKGSPPKVVAVEHFFDYEQVADIAVLREVKATSSPTSVIHTS